MPDLVETGSDIGLQNPTVIDRLGGQMMDLGNRVVCPPAGAEPIRARQKIRLENGLEYQLQARLNHPVGDSRYTEFAEFPACLRYHHLPHVHGPELACL